MKNENKQDWLKNAIFYEIYPQTFNDTNNDGIGDIRGIIEKLDYIESLGVNAIWLNPCFESPFIDAGYDVADYYKVAPRYGTNDDLKELFVEAKKRGIRILLDLVPGHTSTECEWFTKSAAYKKSKYDDWFVWTDNALAAKTAGMRFIGGNSQRNGQYLINFFYCQPALNFGFSDPDPEYPWQVSTNAPGPMAVKEEIKNIVRYWLNMGASGFRVDMASSLVKKGGALDPEKEVQPETCQFWQDVRSMLDSEYPEAVLISEWFKPEQAIPAGFHSDFIGHSFILGLRKFLGLGKNKTRGEHTDVYGIIPESANELFEEFKEMIEKAGDSGYVSLFSCNHDLSRAKQNGVTDGQLETYFAILLTLPGVPFIYYGDEIGMRYIEDLPSVEGGYNRCGSRTPMQWNKETNAGFSSADPEKLYLPIDSEKTYPDVNTQEKDSNSLLNNLSKLIAVKNNNAELSADMNFKLLDLETSNDVVAYTRDENVLCLFNLGSSKAQCKPIGNFNKSYKILASTESCQMQVTDKKLLVTLPSRSYIIIKFSN